MSKLYRWLSQIDQRYSTRYLRIALGTAVAAYMLGGYYGIGSWRAAQFAAGTVQPVNLALAFDQWMPTLPWSVWFYYLYIPMIVSPGFLQLKFSEFLGGCLAYVLGSSAAFAFYLAWPVRMEYPQLRCEGLSCEALRLLHGVDGGLNVFPSLHVSHCTLAVLLYWRAGVRARWLVLAGALCVVAATLGTRQHYVIDLPAGLVVALSAWWISERVRRHMERQN